jgi:diacylglycerol O-acyltransferase
MSPPATDLGSGAERLSLLDASFLYLEQPTELLHVGAVTILDGELPFETLAPALATRLGTIQRYRERPRRPFLDLALPSWERDPDFDARRHIHRVVLPAPADEAQLHAVVNRLFATPLDAGQPLWESHVIEGLPGRTAILSKVHHCMIDGVSGARVLDLMADTAAPPRAGETAGSAIPGRGRAGAFAGVLESALGAWGAAAALGDTTRAVVAAARLAGTPVRPLPFNGRLTAARRIVWTSFPLEQFLAMRGAAGCKVNDVVLAVIAGGMRRYLLALGTTLEGMRPRTLVPVSVRGAGDRGTLGNRVSAMLATLPLDLDDPLERLHSIAHEMRTLKEQHQRQAFDLVLGLAAASPAAVGAFLTRSLSQIRLANLVCTNVPGSAEQRTLLGRPIAEVHPIVPLALDMGLGFAILSYGGVLSISATLDPTLVPEGERLSAALADSAAELAARLNVSPRPEPRPTPAGAPPASLRVSDLMTREVVTIAAHDSLVAAWTLMRDHRIRHLPVLDRRGHLLGIVSHRDLLAASQSSLSFRHERDRVRLLAWGTVADAMETHVSTAAPEESAAAAGGRMIRHKIGCLPVVARDGHLAGIVTEEDFLRWATVHMAAPAA